MVSGVVIPRWTLVRKCSGAWKHWQNIVIIHRTHVFRCAPEQLRLAAFAERQLIATPEIHLLGVKDMIEHGTFRSAQYVDLTSQACPAVEMSCTKHCVLTPVFQC